MQRLHFGKWPLTPRLNKVRRFRVEFGVLVLLTGLVPVGFAADHSAIVSGVVRDSKGVPQMGALVQVLSSNSTVRATAYTDLQGHYLVRSLLPGLYGVRASAALSIPALRGDLVLKADRHAVVNLTLSGLFDELAWLPARAKGADEGRDDWNWTLRSSASRPILKAADDGITTATDAERSRKKALRARVDVASPSGRFGEGRGRVSVRAGRQDGAGADLAVSTFVGGGAGAGEISSTMRRPMGQAGEVATRVSVASHPEIASGAHGAGLQLITISSAERFSLGDMAEIEAGNRVQAVRGAESTVVSRPFLRVSAHPASLWTVTYSLASSPEMQDFESAVMGEQGIPTAASWGGSVETEKGLHQAIALSHRTRGTLVAIALYADALDRMALSGGGALSDAAMPLGEMSDVLVDQSNGAFEALHDGVQDTGINVLVTQALGQGAWVALQYCTGTALATAGRQGTAGALPTVQAHRGESATISVKANVADTRTRVRASYRWQPGVLVTSIDPYDVLAGGDYLSFHLRQPVQFAGILPEGTELTIDGANVLGQGYARFSGRNGTPLFLASTPRSVQAGLAFNF